MTHHGELNRRIIFVGAVLSGRTPKGGPIYTPGGLARAWAKKTDASDGERIAAQQVGAHITARFITQWSKRLAGVDPKARIICAGLTFDISGCKEIGRREWLEWTATSRADAVTDDTAPLPALPDPFDFDECWNSLGAQP